MRGCAPGGAPGARRPAPEGCRGRSGCAHRGPVAVGAPARRSDRDGWVPPGLAPEWRGGHCGQPPGKPARMTTDGGFALLPRARRDVPAPAAAEQVVETLRADLALAGTGGVLAAARQVSGQLFGAGPLDPVLSLAGVSDVVVNGPGIV